MDLNNYCSMTEFARLCGVTPGYVRILVCQGKLTHIRPEVLDRKPMIPRSLVPEWSEGRGARPRISAPKKKRKKRKAA